MPKLFHELREQLLRAGVAPRHVRRYLAELGDHLADLRAEENRPERNPADTEAAAMARLGSMDNLAKAMIERRQFQSWCIRAPWAMFSLAPALVLAGAWIVALFILWSGWNIFLPGAVTPFGTGHYRFFDLANLYFQFGKAIYFFSPIIVGWAIGLIAVRQRVNALWPLMGCVIITLLAVTRQVHANPPVSPGGLAHVSIGFSLAPLVQSVPYGLLHALTLLSLMAMPYLVWRLQQTYSRLM